MADSLALDVCLCRSAIFQFHDEEEIEESQAALGQDFHGGAQLSRGRGPQRPWLQQVQIRFPTRATAKVDPVSASQDVPAKPVSHPLTRPDLI